MFLFNIEKNYYAIQRLQKEQIKYYKKGLNLIVF